MSRVAVCYLEKDAGRSETAEILTLARRLGAEDVTTYVLAESAGRALPAVGRLVVGTLPSIEALDSEGLYQAVRALLGDERPTWLLLPEGRLLQEVAARLAGAWGYEVVLDATEAVREGAGLQLRRQAFGGKAVVNLFASGALVLGLRAGSLASEPVPPVDGEVRALETPAGILTGRRRTEEHGPGLKEARVIVSGGRGLGSREAFAELERFARAIGGVVGASRAAVDEGWAKPEQQVGLTGAKVAPEVYIAIGISGASQHLAGMSSARTVLAVNTDARAPIVQAADVTFVADWQGLWPLLRQAMGVD